MIYCNKIHVGVTISTPNIYRQVQLLDLGPAGYRIPFGTHRNHSLLVAVDTITHSMYTMYISLLFPSHILSTEVPPLPPSLVPASSSAAQPSKLLEGIEKVRGVVDTVMGVAVKLNGGSASPSIQTIRSRCDSRVLRAGVVGLTNSGKSTLLNAMTGGEFLPSSIQAQTAAEVKIVHSPTTQNGELLLRREGSNEPEKTAVGSFEIYKRLEQLNKELRTNRGTGYEAIILHAPLKFMQENEVLDKLRLELSDTGGVNEVNKLVSSKTQVVLKDLSAFIVILHVSTFSTTDVARLLQELKFQHPSLLTLHTRILVLVNAIDICIEDCNKASIQPQEIPELVAKTLGDPEVINVKIPTDRILPFSALWALRSIQWQADVKSLRKDVNCQDLAVNDVQYDKAVLFLRAAGLIDRRHKLDLLTAGHRDPKSLQEVCELLEQASRIGQVEDKIRDMLCTNGPVVLLESVKDDLLREISGLRATIEVKMKEEGSKQQKANVKKQEKILEEFRKVSSKYIKAVEEMEHQVQALLGDKMAVVVASFESKLKNTVSTKLTEKLDNHSLRDNISHDVVVKEVRQVRSLVEQPAFLAGREQWAHVMSIARADLQQHLSFVFLELKNALMAAGLQGVPLPAPSEVPLMVAGAPTMEELQFSSALGIIGEEDLDKHVTEGTIEKLRAVDKKIRTRHLLGHSTHHLTTYEPYSVAAYTPDISGLSSAFDPLVGKWKEEFAEHLTVKLREVFARTGKNASNHLRPLLDKEEDCLKNTLEGAKEVVKQADRTLVSLGGLKEKLKEADEWLRNN